MEIEYCEPHGFAMTLSRDSRLVRIEQPLTDDRVMRRFAVVAELLVDENPVAESLPGRVLSSTDDYTVWEFIFQPPFESSCDLRLGIRYVAVQGDVRRQVAFNLDAGWRGTSVRSR